MHHFAYQNGILHAENTSIPLIAEAVGTPFYCYSEATLRRHYRVFSDAFDGADALIAYSVKSNSNLSVIAVLASEGAGADVVSAGEMQRARLAGVPANKIVFSGVGKTKGEMALALDENIYQFNVESENELLALNEVALSKNIRAPIAFRVNPDVSAGGHEKISTGKAEAKFGVPWERSRELYASANRLPGIDVKGVDVHIGSQISELAPFEAALKRVGELVLNLRHDGINIERLDLGGGLGIPYEDGGAIPPSPSEYAHMIRRLADPLGVQLIFEPGRMITGNAGILVTRTIYRKSGSAKEFLIVDAAMNDLIRPALYDAFHAIRPVIEPQPDASETPIDIVGPVCETGDRFAIGRNMPPVVEGELLAIMSSGAYGAVQASQYNSRPLVPEVMVNDASFAVIRRRPTFDEMIATEVRPDWL